MSTKPKKNKTIKRRDFLKSAAVAGAGLTSEIRPGTPRLNA